VETNRAKCYYQDIIIDIEHGDHNEKDFDNSMLTLSNSKMSNKLSSTKTDKFYFATKLYIVHMTPNKLKAN
jgi:hypothetical protein